MRVQHVSPTKIGNRAKASSLVLSREAKAPLSQRIASSITGTKELSKCVSNVRSHTQMPAGICACLQACKCCARVLYTMILIERYAAMMPCFGMHSQVLDDDILNPGHTIAKR